MITVKVDGEPRHWVINAKEGSHPRCYWTSYQKEFPLLDILQTLEEERDIEIHINSEIGIDNTTSS